MRFTRPTTRASSDGDARATRSEPSARMRAPQCRRALASRGVARGDGGVDAREAVGAARRTRRARDARDGARGGAARRELDDGKTNDDDDDDDGDRAGRRATLVGACAAAVTAPTRARDGRDAANVTARAYLDVGACEGAANAARALGDDGGAPCATPEPFGRIVVGLYGDAAPDTVRNFLALCSNAAETPTLAGTTFHKIDKGNGYVVGGKSGSPRLGQVSALTGRGLVTVTSRARPRSRVDTSGRAR